jgi:hypothetical protein
MWRCSLRTDMHLLKSATVTSHGVLYEYTPSPSLNIVAYEIAASKCKTREKQIVVPKI